MRYYGAFQREMELWIVMEYCPGSSLTDIMEARQMCMCMSFPSFMVPSSSHHVRILVIMLTNVNIDYFISDHV